MEANAKDGKIRRLACVQSHEEVDRAVDATQEWLCRRQRTVVSESALYQVVRTDQEGLCRQDSLRCNPSLRRAEPYMQQVKQ